LPPFILDTNIWIRMKDNHPPGLFKKFWVQVDGSIAAGHLRSPEEVLKELERGTDDLGPLLKAKAGLFVPLDATLQAAVEEVNTACTDLSDYDNDRDVADPFVVALARLLTGTVVTDERPRRSPDARRKIPDACTDLGVPCRKWFEFLAEIGWDL